MMLVISTVGLICAGTANLAFFCSLPDRLHDEQSSAIVVQCAWPQNLAERMKTEVCDQMPKHQDRLPMGGQ